MLFRSLETSFRRRNLVHLAAGSQVPLLRHSIWLVVRGMVKLGSLTIHGDDLLLGLASEPSIVLAKRLVEVAPGRLSRVFYSDAGATAVEIAGVAALTPRIASKFFPNWPNSLIATSTSTSCR